MPRRPLPSAQSASVDAGPALTLPAAGTSEMSSYAEQIGRRARRQARMLSALVAVQRDFLVDGAAHEVFERMLHELIGLSDSEYGFIGEVLHDELGEPFVRMHGLTDVAWDAHTRTLYERARGGG